VIALRDRLRFGSRSLTAASGTTIAIVPQLQAGPTSQRRLRAFCILIHGSTIRLGSNGNGLSDVRAPRCSLRQDKKGAETKSEAKKVLSWAGHATCNGTPVSTPNCVRSRSLSISFSTPSAGRLKHHAYLSGLIQTPVNSREALLHLTGQYRPMGDGQQIVVQPPKILLGCHPTLAIEPRQV